MATPADIGWGSYKGFEGPFYKGKFGFVMPGTPTESDLIMAVITATEGGHWDAYNGYDRCICTSGLIQWCEAGQFSVSDMLGAVGDKRPELLNPVDLIAVDSGMEFQKNDRGRWRFFFNDARGEVDRLQEQQQQFLLRSNGTIGSWDDLSKAYAKKWAAAISSVWENPDAQKIQGDYTARRLMGFVMPEAQKVLAMAPPTNIGRAFKAAYLSFAANNPARASDALQAALPGAGTAWSLDWLIAVLKSLTFNPGVAIYPHRYECIRPVLEKLYGLDLPDLSQDLQAWQEETGTPAVDTGTIQRALIALGYDLGPTGADGKFGPKTKDALLTFEQLSGLPNPDGVPDALTTNKLKEAVEAKGLTFT